MAYEKLQTRLYRGRQAAARKKFNTCASRMMETIIDKALNGEGSFVVHITLARLVRDSLTREETSCIKDELLSLMLKVAHEKADMYNCTVRQVEDYEDMVVFDWGM